MLFYVIVALCLVGGVIGAGVQRGGLDRWPFVIRLSTASFILFNLISGIPWLVWTRGNLWNQAHISLEGVSTLAIAGVQMRGAFEIVLGLLAVAGSLTRSRARLSAILGVFVYNLLMTYEAVNAQFTDVSNPTRWVLNALLFFWTCGFGYQLFNTRSLSKGLSDGRASLALRTGLGLCALWSIGFGSWLYILQPSSLVGLAGYAEIVRHAAHAVGAEYLGLALCAFAAMWEDGEARRAVIPIVLLACVLVSLIAAAAGFPPPEWAAFQRLVMLVHLGFLGGLYAAWRIANAETQPDAARGFSGWVAAILPPRDAAGAGEKRRR